MDDISLVLNPPRFVKRRSTKPIRITRSASRVWPLAAINGRTPVVLDATHPGQRGIELAYPRLALPTTRSRAFRCARRTAPART